MDKRYQVFISSTYADLKEERGRVIQTVIEMGCMPAGMELFPAADEEQFEFIKRVINDCDYYLLIIGGRYGSVASDGTSYTEKEYEYAISAGLKVIALVHEDPDSIPLGKSEKEPAVRERLRIFREKVCTNRLVKSWKNAGELPALVALSLSHVMNASPAVGWTRANRPATEDILTEVNGLRKQNTQLEAELKILRGSLKPQIPDLAGLDDAVALNGTHYKDGYSGRRYWTATLKWRDIFGYIAPYLITFPGDKVVAGVLSEAAFKLSSGDGSDPKLDDQIFRTVSVQLRALGLVELQYLQNTSGGMGLFWSATPPGNRLMFELRAVRKTATTQSLSK